MTIWEKGEKFRKELRRRQKKKKTEIKEEEKKKKKRKKKGKKRRQKRGCLEYQEARMRKKHVHPRENFSFMLN